MNEWAIPSISRSEGEIRRILWACVVVIEDLWRELDRRGLIDDDRFEEIIAEIRRYVHGDEPTNIAWTKSLLIKARDRVEVAHEQERSRFVKQHYELGKDFTRALKQDVALHESMERKRLSDALHDVLFTPYPWQCMNAIMDGWIRFGETRNAASARVAGLFRQALEGR